MVIWVKLLLGNGRKNKAKGFTLIELITVIGIIAVLSVAIIPTVTGAKDRATKARYLSDCKAIVTAVEMYNATSSKDSIGETTTIKELKEKLLDQKLTENRFIKNWPKKLPDNINDNSKYEDILTFISSFD
jgi:prepilin-type N-terminal cleavage/methylation domain-containing protein